MVKEILYLTWWKGTISSFFRKSETKYLDNRNLYEKRQKKTSVKIKKVFYWVQLCYLISEIKLLVCLEMVLLGLSGLSINILPAGDKSPMQRSISEIAPAIYCLP